MIRPGLHVLRRDLRTLQLGMEWPGVAALHDDDSVRAVLAAIDGFRDLAGVVLAAVSEEVDAERVHRALEVLIEAGVVVDRATAKPAALDDQGWAALWLLSGPQGSAASMLAARSEQRVHVEGKGRIARLVRGLLAKEQLRLVSDAADATVEVIAADREPSRARADDAMRRGRPFLCVGVRELVGIVGPFVVPGRTACQRCVDLCRAQLDRCWPTLLESAAAKPSRLAACPPSLVSVTAGYAAQEVALWASGCLPVSCDHVVEIPHGLGAVDTVAYPPHPECGCGWVASADTMSA